MHVHLQLLQCFNVGLLYTYYKLKSEVKPVHREFPYLELLLYVLKENLKTLYLTLNTTFI